MENKELKFLTSAKGIILGIIALLLAAAGTVLCVNMYRVYGESPSLNSSVVMRDRTADTDANYAPIMSYKELSYTYRGLASTSVEWTDLGDVPESTESGLYFISKENLRYCIYDSDANALCGSHTLADFNYMWLNSEDDGFYVVINLAGKEIDLSGYYVLARDSGYMYASRVLINCYEAETVDLSDAIFVGTLLAPYAEVRYKDTYVFGQVLADSATGEYTTYREIKFTGYYSVMESQDSVTFYNDAVREQAVRYLMTHNENGLYDSYNENSKVRKSDLPAVKALDLSGRILKDSIERDLQLLNGLERLDLSDTNLTSLNLADFEYLTELYANNTPLREIDLSGAPSLMRLELEHTELTELDLGANNQLRILQLAGSPLRHFPDVPEPYMEYIDISDAALTDQTVHGTNFPVLKTLILKNNPELKGLELQEFGALRELDLTGTGVAVLTLPAEPELVYLRLSDTAIETLDLTAIKHLYVCEIYSDKLRELIVNRYADTLYTNVKYTVVQA